MWYGKKKVKISYVAKQTHPTPTNPPLPPLALQVFEASIRPKAKKNKEAWYGKRQKTKKEERGTSTTHDVCCTACN